PVERARDPGLSHLPFAANARQLHHHPRLGDILARKLARFSVVDAAIDAIDDKILAVGHFVGDADLDDAADDRFRFPCATEDGEVAGRAFDAVRTHDPV